MTPPEFDRIADVYDETRRALDEKALESLKGMLAKHGCHSILEIGVGTARVALPLAKSGFEITGLDISRRMMEKAQAKGFRNLVLAEGRKIPFREKSFDATLMAHVFHLLPDPLVVMREAAKMGAGVFALVRKKPDDARRGPSWFSFLFESQGDHNAQVSDTNPSASRISSERRDRFRQIAEKYGYAWDRTAQRLGSWAHEYEILEKYPPDDIQVASVVVVSESFEERISRLEKGVFSSLSSMPEGMRKELVEEIRSFAEANPEIKVTRQRQETFQIAMWSSEKLLQSKL